MFSTLKQEKPVLIEAPGKAQKVVIWLHGLGADGHDFEEIVPHLSLPEQHGIRFIFPHAPISPVTINGGMQMHSWYDIRSENLLEDVDAAGVRVSCYRVFELIENQIKEGITASNIYLAGFSQGGLVALNAALSGQYSLGGVIALSTYCPMAEQFYLHRDMPILMLHGEQDPVVPIHIAEASRDAIQKGGYQVEWHSFDMQHQVCAEELVQIGEWLQART
ncbi:alpha/beta hydrolase [Thiosulfatimonas sediminis]|uniref:alpha/beta hydrolase n=1 Tax=Thiosulfatimonas sediminis TaxID=2675054 RepID=UPI001FB9B2AC|nr:alpha/beta hydrolase [Thiosulfatimonas sediminis]